MNVVVLNGADFDFNYYYYTPHWGKYLHNVIFESYVNEKES